MLYFLKILEAGRVLMECLGSCLGMPGGCGLQCPPVYLTHVVLLVPGLLSCWRSSGTSVGPPSAYSGGGLMAAAFPRQPEMDQLEKGFPDPTQNNSVDTVRCCCHLLALLPGCLVSFWTWGLCEGICDALRRVLLLAGAGAQGLSI